MAKKTSKNELFCHACGCNLTPDNCRKTAESASGYSHLCVDCESKMFERIAQTQGRFMGLFFTCLALDCPCSPFVLEDCMDEFNNGDNAWILYINKLAEKKAHTKRGKPLGFADGAVKSLQELFGKDLKHTDFVAYIDKERKAIANKPKPCGTEEQRERWGTQAIYKGLPMSQELYDELDMLYENRAEGLKGTTITPQIEYTLVTVAKNMAIYNHLLRNGLIKPAQDMWKTIDGMLASENLRKKDEKPVEALRIDALVLALEEAGLMENGELLTYDELLEVMRDKFVKSKKYEQSLDVADQVILDIINSMRTNADLPTIQDLPEEFAAVDEYGEFEAEETEREKENKWFLGITKVNVVKSDKGDNE